MQQYDYLIVGGGIAGTTAAEAIRKRDREGSIAILSAEPHVLYARDLLSKPEMYTGEYDAKELFLKTEDWYRVHHIDLLLGRRASEYDPHQSMVRLEDGAEIEYGKMLLAMGTRPHTYEPKGAKQNEIVQLQTIDDALALRERLGPVGVDPTHLRRVLVVGKGFIAFEAAHVAHTLGARVVVVNKDTHPFAGVLSASQGQHIRDAMEGVGEGGVAYMASSTIESISDGDEGREAVLREDIALPFDVLVAGVGVTTPSGWLHRVDRTTDGAALVNAHLETNIPRVWAAGDCAVLRDGGTRCGNWETAMEMGQHAGENMAGDIDAQKTFVAVPVYTAEAFGVHLAFVGQVGEREGITTKEDGMVRRFLQGDILVGVAILDAPERIEEMRKEILAQKG